MFPKSMKNTRSAPGRSRDGLGHPPCNSKIDFWSEKVTPKGDFGAKLGGQVGPKSLFLVQNCQKITKKSIQEGVQKKFRKMMEK